MFTCVLKSVIVLLDNDKLPSFYKVCSVASAKAYLILEAFCITLLVAPFYPGYALILDKALQYYECDISE